MDEEALALLARQLGEWPLLARAHAALTRADHRDFHLEGALVRVQCNPGRVTSNRARVDRAAIAARPCFLCDANRPPQQEALAWGDEWLILANPAPIFPAHFTLVHRTHGYRPLAGMVPAMCDLARDLAPGLTLFYNGPRSGASAPDHFHFQACSPGLLPTVGELFHLSGPTAGRVVGRSIQGGLPVTLVETGGRSALLLVSSERDRLVAALAGTLALLPPGEEGEPDLNLVCRHREGRWEMVLFPRSAHRPECYYLPPGEEILVSPGAADLAGLVVVTRELDLERLDAGVLRTIYGQVSLPVQVLAPAFAMKGRQ